MARKLLVFVMAAMFAASVPSVAFASGVAHQKDYKAIVTQLRGEIVLVRGPHCRLHAVMAKDADALSEMSVGEQVEVANGMATPTNLGVYNTPRSLFDHCR